MSRAGFSRTAVDLVVDSVFLLFFWQQHTYQLSHLTFGQILVLRFSVCRKRCPFRSAKPAHLKALLKHGSPRFQLDSKVCSSPQQRNSPGWTLQLLVT